MAKYFIEIEGESFEVQDRSFGNVQVNGKEVELDIDNPHSKAFSVISNAKQYRIVIVDDHLATVNGESYHYVLRTEREELLRTYRSNSRQGEHHHFEIVAPMPGLFSRMVVKEGDQVTKGQTVGILEAMKMENELKSISAGVVKRILIQPGTVVEKGTVLLQIEE